MNLYVQVVKREKVMMRKKKACRIKDKCNQVEKVRNQSVKFQEKTLLKVDKIEN